VACQKQESDELDYATDVTETLSEKQLHSKGCCGFEARQEFVSHSPPASNVSGCYEHRPPGLGACLGGAALAHRPSFFVTSHAVVLLPPLDLLSWFNDTSIDSL
jgi:hypothetical protein